MPNRILKDWTTSKKIDSLSESQEVFFIRLIMKADDHGCFHANPKLLRAALFPYKDYPESKVLECLAALASNGIIKLYAVDGGDFLKINDFGQRLRNMVSKFPQPDDTSLTIDRDPLTISGNQPPETKRIETKGSRNEYTKTFGSGKYYFVVAAKYVGGVPCRVNGVDGLHAFMEENQSVVNLPAFSEKFMRDNNGAHFNDFMHVFNSYQKYTREN